MKINDLSARISASNRQLRAAIERVLDSGWLVLGPEVGRFERSFAEYLGAKHCVGVASGTDALELALRGLDMGAGDRVATVANAGAYSMLAIMAAGAQPFFLDVDPRTCNTTLAEVRRALDAGVKAVILTHLYGRPVLDTPEIVRLCEERSVPVLEDCAQAHGASINGRRVGTFGDIASFSFYPTKNLGALGDGGAVVTSRADLADRVSRLRQYGWSTKYTIEVAGGRNSRLDELQAAILSEFLPELDTANGRRLQIACLYGESIHHPGVQLPQLVKGDVAHLYVVRTRDRESLRAHLKAAGIGCDVHYPVPDHQQPLVGARFRDVQLPVTEQLANEVLTLPCYPEMTDGDVRRVAEVVNAWSAAN